MLLAEALSMNASDGMGSYDKRGSWLRPLAAAALAMLLLAGAQTVGAQAAARSKVHVYLLRGVINVFSLGMDDIAAELQRRGINCSLHNYLVWSALADEAAEEYKSGQVRTIILVGHSAGAGAVTDMAARLGELGVPVKLAIGLDPGFHASVSGLVHRYINYYVAGGMGKAIDRSPQFRGILQNIEVGKSLHDVGHLTIDKNHVMQQRVIRDILAAF